MPGVVLLVLACLLGLAAPAAAADEIVLLRDVDRSVADETRQLERAVGFEAERQYDAAAEGFAADLTPGQVAQLRRSPEVRAVVENRPLRLRAQAPLVGADFIPPGVRRITGGSTTHVREAATSPVAVLDTGIDLEHPDLNVAAGVNCAPGEEGGAPDDRNGHGTHVAGTIGAANDGFGVVGVAPGTKLYAVKVLSDDGAGDTTSILCGMEWVLDNAAATGVGVVNMSLGGGGAPGSTCAAPLDGEHAGLCALAAAGITPVVAAGNEGADVNAVPENEAEGFFCPGRLTTCPDAPGSYDEVLSVSAISDRDGLPGGKGTTCNATPDDRPAGFSNFATTDAEAAHFVAAPGNCVVSTLPGTTPGDDEYGSLSGTSMAAPHVAGLVALCKGEAGAPGSCAGMSTAQVIQRMRAPGAASAYSGIPGRLYGPLALLSELTTPGGPVAEPGSAAQTAAASQPAAETATATATATAPQMPSAPPAVIAPAPPPVADPVGRPSAAARPTLRFASLRLASLRNRGLAVRVRCDGACTGTVRLRVSRAVAKRLKLRSPTLATARVRRAGTVRLRLTRAAKRALARQRTLAATIVADVRSGGRTVRVTKRLSARR